MYKRILILLPFLIIIFSCSSVYASSDVQITSNVTYQYNPSGRCQVIHQIRLTNGPSHVYPTSYQMDIVGHAPEEITVNNSTGPLKFTLQNIEPASTRLTVYLTTPVVGRGNYQDLLLSYLCPPANRKGQNWEIILPQIKDVLYYDKYHLSISIPENFGDLVYSNVSLLSSSPHTYYIEKNQLENVSVTAVFGQFQTYSFSIVYPLLNSGFTRKKVTFPLPSDSSYQKVFLDTLKPVPDNVYLDSEGNWLADVTISPKTNTKFFITGQAHILPSASFLSVYPAQKSRERRVLGVLHNQMIAWKEHWVSSQSTWSSQEFTPNRLFISTDQPQYFKLLSTAEFSVQPSVYQYHDQGNPQINWQSPFQIFPFISNHSQLEIKNTHSQALYWLPVSVNAGLLHLHTPQTQNISVIPPFGKVTLPIDFYSPIIPDLSPHYLSLRVGSSPLTYNIPILSFIVWYAIFIILISIIFICLAWITVRSWSIHLQRLKGADHLRRQSQKLEEPG